METGTAQNKRDRIGEILAQQEVLLEHLTSTAADHEKRIRFLERLVTIASGALFVIKLLIDHFPFK